MTAATEHPQTDLSPFAQGYVEAMLADLNGRRVRVTNEGLDPYAFSDLAPETLARIIADCEAFPSWSGRFDHSRHAGEVFHAQRQRGQWPDSFPPLTVQLGDGGKVVFA